MILDFILKFALRVQFLPNCTSSRITQILRLRVRQKSTRPTLATWDAALRLLNREI